MAGSSGEDQMKKILEDLNLNQLIPKFQMESIDLQSFLSLSESQINKLGVQKLGDVVRLTNKVRLELQKAETNQVGKEHKASTSTQKSSSDLAKNIMEHRNALFGTGNKRKCNKRSRVLPNFNESEDVGDQNKSIKKKKNVKKSRSWTVTVVCLADKDSKYVPSPIDREILFKAGLGQKKIKFDTIDTEADVLEKIVSDEISDNETVGFPQLKQCGGIELLLCRQNSRELSLVECEWNVRNLKSYLGPQAKLYVRPIQKSLSVEPVVTCSDEQAKIKCRNCFIEYSVRELREHLKKCNSSSCLENTECSDNYTHSSDGEDLTDPQLTNRCNIIDNAYTSTCGNMKVACSDVLSTMPHTKDLNNNKPINPTTNFVTTTYTSSLHVPNAEDISNQQLNINHDKDKLNTNPDSSECSNSYTYVLIESDLDNFNKSLDHEMIQHITESTQVKCTSEIDSIISNSIEAIFLQNITEPVEILRFIQEQIITGRKLDISCRSSGEVCEGQTNFIMVNRKKILETALEEIAEIKEENLRKTLEVQFYDETAADFGGPRREFFRLVLAEIEKKYFQNGLREYMAMDYTTVGKIMALSILQNGCMPTFLGDEILNEIFRVDDPSSICTKNLRIGLDCLGLVRIGTVIPAFVYLLRPRSVPLTMKTILRILKPLFSEEGSNIRIYEDCSYAAFVRYVRSVGSGRRPGLSLSNIIEFVTGASEEPVLGFAQQPSIEFVQVRDDLSFLPTANTCSNSMMLPRPSPDLSLPSDDKLFDLYDYAFLNTYYGLV